MVAGADGLGVACCRRGITAGRAIPRGRVDDATLARCTAFGPPEWVREHLEAYVAGGASKFILRPMCPPERMLDQLDQLAAEIVPAFHRRTG